ncbi:MAG TPA: DNA polymerase III subunit gamma/tau [Phycisphaerales bacterium]|nr:DNA polymerase III subunit gamma/tau [Phycisphaerales bacterium]
MAKKASESKSQTSSLKPQAYTVLARRYRSREFDEIVGQEPIARTLLNAIETGRTAHAYLFCGTRGVGKTSMARIFAKALNATDDLKEKDAIGEAILRGDDLDVIEIDAASNRGIDNARDLIAGASLSPARSPYKIYIIDEVHQLTKEAFNALLKTMEEPPAHVKFILCTTEPQKVPATIQSRCQRFDFRAIRTAKIAEHIRRILKDEGVKADDEVVAQVARLGNGSMRDALSILDRLLAGGMESLTVEDLEEMLGLPDHDLIVNLVDALIASDAAGALKAGDELLQKSSGVEQALDLLSDHLRSMMILAACGGEAAFLDLSEEHLNAAKRQAASFDASALVHMIALCDAVSRNSRGSATARSLFDAAMVRLAMSRNFADVTSLLIGGSGAAGDGAKPAVEVEAKKKEPVTERPSADTKAEARPALAAELKPGPMVSIGSSGAPADRASASAASSLASNPLAEPGAHGELWQRVLEIARENMVDRHRVEHLTFQSFDGVTLRLALDDSGADIARFVMGQIERITDLARRAAGGRTVRVEIDASCVAPRAAPNAGIGSEPLPPIIQKAVDLFGATIVAVD